VLARDRIDRLAETVALVRQAEKVTHLIDGEAEIARPVDETEAAQMDGRVGGFSLGCSARPRARRQ